MAKPPKKVPSTLPPDSSGTPTGHSGNPRGATTGEIVHPVPGIASLPSAAGSSSSTAFGTLPEHRPTITIHHYPGRVVEHPSVIVHHFPEGAGPSNVANWVALHYSENQQTAVASSATSGRVQHPVFINAESAGQLKLQPGTEEGFRYDKRHKAYVEMQGGMIMVGHTPDGWRQTYAGESTPTGKRVEQIPGTPLWREIDGPRQGHQTASDTGTIDTSYAMPGPSKRPRLHEDANVDVDVASNTGTLVRRLSVQRSPALDLSTTQWKNWGKTTKPQTGESIEIDGLHYPTVKQVLRADTELVYLQHPGFKPDDFDGFENMLRHEPSKQPKWVLKREGQWRVLDNHLPFEMSPTQYASHAMSYLSEHSANNLARAVFDQVSTHQEIDASGLSLMTLTFRHWIDRVNNTSTRHSLSDPLMLLPTLPTQHHAQYAGGTLSLPAYSSNRLQRLDFDVPPLDFIPGPSSTRDLFERFLGLSGYSINPKRHLHPSGEDVMVFHREGIAAVFVLRLTAVTQGPVPRFTAVGSELSEPLFLSTLSERDARLLAEHLQRYEVIYLLGGKEQISADSSTLFIVREG
jgi:hypothetical protein